jgi:hypothetical protein
VDAQDLAALGVHAGAGISGGGDLVYEALIDLADLSCSPGVAVALRAFGEASARRTTPVSPTREEQEEMRVWGVGLIAEVLLRHSLETRGPYVAVGLGVGPLWFRWRLDSIGPGVPPEIGAEEEGLTVGSILSAGLGQRLHPSVDVRAQATAVLVPSTDLREDLALIPFFTLTAGVRP